MGKIRSIVATTLLALVLSVNSFAGIIMTDIAAQPNPCESQKNAIAVTIKGIILTLSGIILTFSGDTTDTGCTKPK